MHLRLRLRLRHTYRSRTSDRQRGQLASTEPVATLSAQRTFTTVTSSSLACPTCGVDGMLSAVFATAPMCTSCALARWKEAEGVFEANEYCGIGPKGALRYTTGRGEVLFTAPSSVNFWRGDTRLKAARYTGSGVAALAAATGMSALAAAGQPRQVPFHDSPEYAFVDGLREHVAPTSFVLDVLGMRDRSVDVCLGLGPMPDARTEAVATSIKAGFEARGVRVAINTPFAGLAPWTVTSFTQLHLNASAIQVQLAAWLRDPVESPMMAKLTLDVLRAATARALR